MTFITILIIVVFVVGYALIALESATHINKAAVALLMCVACWTLYMVHPADYLPGVTTDLLSSRINTIIEEHLGSISTTLFFLMGAMTIVEVVDQYGGFNFVRDTLKTQSKRGLLWRVVALTFILSAILDNMTTTIVMIMVLRKLVRDHSDRIIYASLIILAANAGGAFSPIGDVTTIMLWNVGSITAAGVIEELLIPSAISIFIPTLILQYKLHGALVEPDASTEETAASVLSGWQHKAVFVLGVGGLIFVPIFRYLTDLPPFVGILLVLAVLWTVTELFFRLSKRAKTAGDMGKRVSQLLGRVDMSTILFFLGILMTVACLEEVSVLTVVLAPKFVLCTLRLAISLVFTVLVFSSVVKPRLSLSRRLACSTNGSASIPSILQRVSVTCINTTSRRTALARLVVWVHLSVVKSVMVPWLSARSCLFSLMRKNFLTLFA